MPAPSQPVGPNRRFSDLRARVLSAAAMIALALGALYAGGVWFLLFWLLAALAINWEWQNLIGAQGARAGVYMGGVGIVMAGVLAAQSAPDYAWAPLFLAAGACAAARPARDLRLWAAGGVLYAGGLIICMAALRPPLPAIFEYYADYNVRAVVWLFAVVWGTDIGAYFGGRLIGGPKLWPAVSAGKTWSGAAAGVGAGALLGLAAACVGAYAPPSVPHILAVGAAASVVSQLGDLFESRLKRRFGVKDSSHLIPGHGGVLDRLDGFVAAALFVVALSWMRGADSAAKGLLIW